MSRSLLAPALALALTAALPVAAAQAASNGPLALVRGTTLSLQPAAGGAPAVRLTGLTPGSPLAASRDGAQLAFLTGPVGDSSRLSIAKPAGGAVRSVTLKGLSVNSLAFSPDRRTLVLTAFRAGDSGVGHVRAYLYRIATRRVTPLRTAFRYAFDAAFTPDGRSVVYVGDRLQEEESSDCASALRRVRIDGTRDTLLYQGAGGSRPCPQAISPSPGGTSVAMTAITAGDEPAGPGPASGVWRLALTKGAKPKLLAATAASPAWSPAGDRIAYGAFGRSDGQYPFSGVTGLFTQPKGGGTPAQLSGEGVSSLAWLAG
jgi:Tol biopolymer transport system component